MKSCNRCSTQLIHGARFCHNCGEKVVAVPLSCPECNAMNLGSNEFCGSCGYPFESNDFGKMHYQAEYPLNFQETSTLASDISDYFFKTFKERISEEHDPSKYNEYLERFYNFDVNGNFELRANQLAEEAYSIHQRQDGQIQQKVDRLLDKNFNNYLDHFIILFCKDLNPVDLPETILSYSEAKLGKVDLRKMVLDYLALDNENEKYYTDFIIMPIQKLKNASKAFLFPKKDEKIFFIADQTVFGSCKQGYAITEKGLYWKAHFDKPHKIFFKDLVDIHREKNWLIIDGKYFNVSPSINLKMLKLLKKLKALF